MFLDNFRPQLRSFALQKLERAGTSTIQPDQLNVASMFQYLIGDQVSGSSHDFLVVLFRLT